jgi:anti-sigma B factor antagonist
MSASARESWPFRCEVAPDGDSFAIRLHGELDMATAPEVDAAFADVAELRVPVTLDLRGLTFMDSRGVRMLVSFNEQAQAAGFPLTVACGDRVQQLLALTGLDRHLSVVQLPGD